MSFSGTIPAQLRQTVVETVVGWPEGEILFPCCGALTSERVIHTQWPGRFTLRSSDVNLVSCALGAAAAGGRLEIGLKEELAERLAFMAPQLDGDGVDVAAVLWLAFRYIGFLSRPGFAQDRFLRGIEAQWPRMFAETRARMDVLPPLASFEPADALDWLAGHPDLPVVTYPPFRNAVSSYSTGDWKMMSKVFAWTEPSYELIDDERYAALLDEVTRREHWLLGLNDLRPELAEHLVMSLKPTNRSPTINVYASEGTLRIVRPRQPTAGVPWRHLLPGEELGEELHLARIRFDEFAGLRSHYMNKGIRPGHPDVAFAVLVDQVLVGCFALMRQAKGVSLRPPWLTANIAYLMSDFPVAPTDYPRLSKLVLAAALSDEARLLCERILRRRFDTLLTTAFTNNPVSMKYRGDMTLYTRKPQEFKQQLEGWVQDQVPDWNSYYRRKWDLNYIARWGERTLEEGYERWQSKHGKRVHAAGAMPATTDR